MTTDKDIAQLLRPICIELAEGVRKGCKECRNGFKITYNCGANTPPDTIKPCPTCTPRYNQLMELADKLCWRTGNDLCPACGGSNRRIVGTSNLGPIYAQDHSLKCNSPRHKHNPRFSIEPIEGYISLVEVLRVLGMLDEFVDWLAIQNVACAPKMPELRKFAKILWDKELLKTAISSSVRRGE
jgi:hypothetical protein